MKKINATSIQNLRFIKKKIPQLLVKIRQPTNSLTRQVTFNHLKNAKQNKQKNMGTNSK